MSSSTSRTLYTAGKGDRPRRRSISEQELNLRWQLYRGEISEKEFNKQLAILSDSSPEDKL